MAYTAQQLAADDDAFIKQSTDAQNAKQAQEAQTKNQPQEPGLMERFGTSVGKMALNGVDYAVANAENYFGVRAARDVGAGVTAGAVNMADAAGSALSTSARGMAAAEDPAHADDAMAGSMPTSPIWDHAKNSILDFRDAVAVKDPTLADNLLQSGAQLAVPFAGFSRALAGIHGIANVALAGAATDATALGPHDPRMADLIALGRHTEGKLGDTLRALTPDGSAQNAYINYIADRGDESEAEGRFKNVLDGFGANMILTPLLSAAGTVIKQGTAGLRYAVENGVGSAGELMPANQKGMVAFHGTTADFNEFDSSKIGTGEGNQTFGHGLYFAENPQTAGTYQRMLEQRNAQGPNTGLSLAKRVLLTDGIDGDRVAAVKELNARVANSADPEFRSKAQQAISYIKSGAANPKGNLMSVDIPDQHIGKMLDWDAPISEQPHVLDALNDTKLDVVPEGNNFRLMIDDKPAGLFADSKVARGAANQLGNAKLGEDMNGGEFYERLVTAFGLNAQKASEFLSAKNIPGNKYLDQLSRGKAEGTHNFVLFDAKHAKVIAKNGKSIAGQERTNMNLSLEDRALERERVAAQRSQEDGLSREHEPEPIPANAAEREGAAARRRKDD